ncbi:probable serine/threonine-protein kinase DDB_G0277071 [Oryzias latipes]|uniref:probable serine/threonine-protein kinase DDB_G0277071 n=1 Tax=Oryzias latipes TaxID=8090 RepID=UPI000CE1B254|nr:probable serine/threonine-protein kinase DDB_G0277071 [Oryzias latipes]
MTGYCTEQRYTWKSLFLPNPSDPDNPRLVVRRIPIPGTSENPEETINSVPKTPTGPVPEFGLSSSSDSPPRSLSTASSASPPTQCSSSNKEDFTGHRVGRCDGPSSSRRSPKTSSNVQLSSSTSLTEQHYTWKSLLLPNPSDPDDPILVVRRILIPGTSENPEETINSVPKTPTGPVPEFGLSSSSDSDSPPQKYLYAPSSPNINPVPKNTYGWFEFLLRFRHSSKTFLHCFLRLSSNSVFFITQGGLLDLREAERPRQACSKETAQRKSCRKM